MNQLERIEHFYRELYRDDFILTHGFQRLRFGTQEFYACASTLRSKSGREITVSFNIHDEAPDEAELVIQLLNKSSMEQIKTVGNMIAQKLHKEIKIYEEPGCISMVSYYDIEDVPGIIEMFKTTLEEINKVVFFTVKLDNKD